LCTQRVVPILNDVDTVLRNSNKFYLRELEGKGVPIAPTLFFSPTGPCKEEHLDQIRGWKRIVVKPAVSASAHKTQVFDQGSLPSAYQLNQSMSGKDFLVQEFVPEIQTGGEISFVYLDAAYSHAIRKRPARGDFRVQKEHGGTAELFHPPARIEQQAHEIADLVADVSMSLYCRLDAVEKNGKLLLMELELIEPELFLGMAEGAAERFSDAIVRRMP
jgi:glutathione synthase/RimK-type ligase-like ATP-grasp enzyme